MRKYLRIWWIAAALLVSCLFTSCGGKKAEESGAEAEKITETPTETPAVTATPIAMEASNTETPSGVKVEMKYQKYKVLQGVNVRSDCDSSSEHKGSFSAGDIVQGTGVCENGWLQLLYNGEVCYATGSCFEEADDSASVTRVDEPTPTPGDASEMPGDFQTADIPGDEADSAGTVDVTEWAKYTSSLWESDDKTSCRVQIHSIAGNQTVFRFEVVDGSLKDADSPDTLRAEANNCYGKIENGVMNFSFTDNYNNAGVGRMEIVDDTHLKIVTFVSQPNAEAEYRAEVMTELTQVE